MIISQKSIPLEEAIEAEEEAEVEDGRGVEEVEGGHGDHVLQSAFNPLLYTVFHTVFTPTYLFFCNFVKNITIFF